MRTASQTTRGFTIEASHATLSSMRRVALGLLAAAGCNQIWGLGPVDLAPPGDGPGDGANVRRIRLTAQITKTTRMGYVDPSLDEGPITPAPLVQLGPIDGPLMSAAYGTDGTVAYPAGFLGKPWGLVYTLADGIPREVHWSPPDGDLVGHIVEPLFGRVPRQPVPFDGGYSITPMGSPAQHVQTRVFTTGVWTLGELPLPPAGAKLDYNFGMKARSLSGPLGAPESAWTDYAVLADFQSKNGCRVTTGAASFPVPDMTAGTLTA